MPYLRTELDSSGQLRWNLSPEDLWPDLDATYAALRQNLLEPPATISAWKLGGTTQTTQDIFRTRELYFGALFSHEVTRAPDSNFKYNLPELKGEIEIALRIANTAGEANTRDTAPELLFDSWCLALELPASLIDNIPDHGVSALVADRCAAGGLILGEPQDLSQLDAALQAPQPFQEVTLVQNDTVLSRGHLQGLLQSPLKCGELFMRKAQELGFPLEPGQWISTGGLCPCVPLEPATPTKVLLGGQAKLEFITPAKET